MKSFNLEDDICDNKHIQKLSLVKHVRCCQWMLIAVNDLWIRTKKQNTLLTHVMSWTMSSGLCLIDIFCHNMFFFHRARKSWLSRITHKISVAVLIHHQVGSCSFFIPISYARQKELVLDVANRRLYTVGCYRRRRANLDEVKKKKRRREVPTMIICTYKLRVYLHQTMSGI